VHPSTGRLSLWDVTGGGALEGQSTPGAFPPRPTSMTYQLNLHSQEKKKEGGSMISTRVKRDGCVDMGMVAWGLNIQELRQAIWFISYEMATLGHN